MPTTCSISSTSTPSPIRELILVRHGRTAWNAARRFQGQSDIPLSDEGRAEAAATALALAGEPLDAVVSSDLSRALETARAVAERRLREFAFGEWEGLTWEQIAARYPVPEEMAFWSVRDYAPPGGERFSGVRERAQAALRDHAGAGERVAFVTHAGLLHALRDILVGSETETRGIRLTPSSITRVKMDGRRPELISLDDVRHLG